MKDWSHRFYLPDVSRPMAVLILGGGNIGMACMDEMRLDPRFIATIYETDEQLFSMSGDISSVHPDLVMKHVTDFFVDPLKYLKENTFDYVINAVPIYNPDIIVQLIYACNKTNTNYIDFSEDVNVLKEVQHHFADLPSNVLIAMGCGLAPGAIQIIANGMALPFDEVNTIEMYVGALTPTASNSLQYHATWSPTGIANEYLNDSTGIDDGKIKSFPSCSLLSKRDIVVKSIPFEAFATSGGAGTLLQEWEGRCQSMSYRTIRHRGHLDSIKNLLQSYQYTLDVYGDEAIALQKAKLAYDLSKTVLINEVEDIVVVNVDVTGVSNGKERSSNFSTIMYGITPGTRSAICRLTAGGAMLIIHGHITQQIQRTGLFRQEQIPMSVLSHDYFGKIAGWPNG